MRSLRHSLLATLLIGFGIVASQVSAQAPDKPPVPSGKWGNAAIVAAGNNMFSMQTFEFNGDRWAIKYQAFADPAGKVPLFTLDNSGVFAIGGPSAKVPGAWEGIFPQTRRNLTADSDAGVVMFAQMGCPLVKGQAKAVMQQPCGFIAPLMQSMGEYDLVMIKDGQFFFGDRSGDLSKARPEKLNQFPMVQK